MIWKDLTLPPINLWSVPAMSGARPVENYSEVFLVVVKAGGSYNVTVGEGLTLIPVTGEVTYTTEKWVKFPTRNRTYHQPAMDGEMIFETIGDNPASVLILKW